MKDIMARPCRSKKDMASVASMAIPRRNMPMSEDEGWDDELRRRSDPRCPTQHRGSRRFQWLGHGECRTNSCQTATNQALRCDRRPWPLKQYQESQSTWTRPRQYTSDVMDERSNVEGDSWDRENDGDGSSELNGAHSLLTGQFL